MFKRSVVVLALLVAGAACGVVATGALRLRDGIAMASAGTPAREQPRTGSPEPEPVSHPVPAPQPEAPAPVAPQNGPATNGSPRIAVVNLRVCFDEANYDYAKEITNDLKKLRTELEGNLKDLGKQLEDLKAQADGLQRGSALWQDKVRKAKLIEMQYKLDGELSEAKLRSEVARLQLDMYNEIRRVIEIYGRDKKFDFILRVEEPQLDEEMQRVVSQQIAQRVVLFHADAFDVTKDVLKLLNTEYAARKARAAAQGPAPAPTVRRCPDPACGGIETMLDKCPKCNKEIPKK